MNIENPKTGKSITGMFKGYFETQNNGYTNRFIAVTTSEYQDRYGNTQENIEEISVSEDQISSVKNADQVGKPCRVWVGQNVQSGISKAGKPYGFLRQWMLKNTSIEFLTSKPKAA